jgi:hypothetical protein
VAKWGDDVVLEVAIPADLSHTGLAYRKKMGIDRCIAPLVAALNAAGIETRGSCCGHGKGPGWIMLADRSELTIAEAEDVVRKHGG